MVADVQLPSAYRLISDKYTDDLMNSVLDSVNPVFSAIPYIKRKRQSHKFNALNRINEILAKKRSVILPKLINALPAENRWDAYLQAKSDIIKILGEELSDVMEELDNLMNMINEHELKNSLKIDIKKQIGVLNAIRDEIIEEMYSSDMEDDNLIDTCLTLDQGIALLIKLYEKNLEKSNLNTSALLSTMILSLRIMAILQEDTEQVELLKNDIVEITPILEEKTNDEIIHNLIEMVC